ncbi:MAG: sugar phosphate isomerase/epimerase family protein [Actinomycetota bacterium]
MTPRFSYVTNGLADHRLGDALVLLAEHGYQGVAITLGHHHLDPFAPDLRTNLRELTRLLERLGLAVAIETGARFVLDARRKHEPSLISERRERRLDLLWRAIDIAAALGAEGVSFFSGVTPSGVPGDAAWGRLMDGCAQLLERAAAREVLLGLEPEPGMLIERVGDYEELARRLGNPKSLGVTLDLGHCLCLEEEPVGSCILRAGPRLVSVHIEDMRRGVHEHLDFGEGEMDFPAALSALEQAGYRGLISVELPRHSHLAHLMIPHAIRFLRSAASDGHKA